MHDLRYALRQFVKFPGYTTVVVLTLAFGIAVNTQIFAIVSSIFLQPMPVRDADRLNVIFERSNMFNMPHGMSFLDFQDIRAGSKALTDHVASFFFPSNLSTPGQPPERTWIEAVTPDALQKYGVPIVLGRSLQSSDGELPPATPVAVLTHRTWQRQFGGDPAVIGRTILINTKPFTVVGVVAPGFESFSYSISSRLFIPSGALAQVYAGGDSFFKYRSAKAWRVLTHRAPGFTDKDANAELAVFAQRFNKEFPGDHRNSRFISAVERRARPDPSLTDFAPLFVAMFSGLVVLVLLIACANVANLMGAHALNRQKELVVRAALGASRSRLIRQLLIESVVLAVVAGIVGYYLSDLSSSLLAQFAPHGDIPMREFRPPDRNLVGFTIVVSLIAGLAAGLMPALRSSRVDLNESLKQGADRGSSGQRHRLRNLLVIGQVAVSCVVLVAAALFLRALHAAADLDLGFRPERLLMLSVDLGLQGYDQERGLRFQKQLIEEIRVLPGVSAATFAKHVPFTNNISIANAFPDNPTTHLVDNQLAVANSSVQPGYLSTMGVPLQRGRALAEADDARAPFVAVINEAMARAFWPGKSALGEHFHLDWAGAPPIEVVGVVPTGKYVMLMEEPKPYFYMPFAQRYSTPMTLVVRTVGDPAGLAKTIRDTVHRLDPDLPVYDETTFEHHLASSLMALMPLRMGATVAGVQGALALILAVLGLYAVVSYGVTSRTREIGVRIALGATTQNVVQLISREGLRLTAIGLAVGFTLSLLLAFGLSHVVFGVKVFDAVALPAVLLLLFATAALACWLPARRATRVDPMVALRAE
jgi:predicted permease